MQEKPGYYDYTLSGILVHTGMADAGSPSIDRTFIRFSIDFCSILIFPNTYLNTTRPLLLVH